MSMMDNFNELEPKQKSILVVTIILFAFVIYMGWGILFPGGSSSTQSPKVQEVSAPAPSQATTTQPTPSQQQAAAAPEELPAAPEEPRMDDANQDLGPQAPGIAATSGQLPSQAEPQPLFKEVKTIKADAPTAEQRAMMEQSKELQKEYLDLINKFQIAQLEQKLAQTNAAIEQAKLQTTMTKVKAQQIEAQIRREHAKPLLSQPAAPSKPADVDLNVKYVAKIHGRWTAMLAAGDSLFEVREGTHLSDGSVVTVINDKGVVLTRHGKKIFLTIPKTFD